MYVHDSKLKSLSMPPKVLTINAVELNRRFAVLLAEPPYVEAKTPYWLHHYLTRRVPPVPVSMGTVKQWWMKYKVTEGSIRLTTAAELHEKYGESILHMAAEYPTAFKLCKALRDRDPPICIDDGIAKEWLRNHGGQSNVKVLHSGGHLETYCGDRIRAHDGVFNLGDTLASWLNFSKVL